MQAQRRAEQRCRNEGNAGGPESPLPDPAEKGKGSGKIREVKVRQRLLSSMINYPGPGVSQKKKSINKQTMTWSEVFPLSGHPSNWHKKGF